METILQKYLLCNLYFCCWMLCKFPNSEQQEQGIKMFQSKKNFFQHTFICTNLGTNFESCVAMYPVRACVCACARACVCVCGDVMLCLGEKNLTMNILHGASVCARWVWGQWLPNFQLKISFPFFQYWSVEETKEPLKSWKVQYRHYFLENRDGEGTQSLLGLSGHTYF